MPKVTKEVFDSRRFTFVGDVSVTEKGVASGFSTSNYVKIDSSYKLDNAIYYVKFTTGDNLTTDSQVFHISKVLSIEGKSDNLYAYNWGTSSGYNLLTMATNTTYWVKVEVNGTTKTYSYSTDGETYETLTTFTDSGMNTTANYEARFGISSYDSTQPWLGTIDLGAFKITSLDGEVIFDNSIITVERIEPLLHRSSISKETKVVYDSTDFDTYGSIVVDKNGIASGFNTTSWIGVPVSIAKASTSTVTIKGQWTYGTSSGDVAIMWEFYATSEQKFRQEIKSDGGSTQIYHADATSIGVVTFDTALVAGDVIDIDVTIDFANNTFTETLTVNSSKTYTLSATTSYSSTTYSALYLGLFYGGSSRSYPWDGTIDLKTIEVTVDGTTIIKGSKTVTVTNQTLKAVKGDKAFDKSKFTIVGSPTITDDGVASGFSKNNDVETNFTLSNLLNKKWSIDITGTLGDMSRNSVLFSVSQTVKWSGFGGAYITAKGSCSVQVAVGTGSQQEIDKQVLWAQAIFSSYDVVRVVLSYDGIDEYSAQVFKNGTLIKTGTYTAPTADKNLYLANLHPNEFINIGDGWQADSTSNFCWLGSIDLKQFSITVDGKEVFSGTKDIYKAFI